MSAARRTIAVRFRKGSLLPRAVGCERDDLDEIAVDAEQPGFARDQSQEIRDGGLLPGDLHRLRDERSRLVDASCPREPSGKAEKPRQKPRRIFHLASERERAPPVV